MKIRLLSDLHTEFRLPYKTQPFVEYRGEDVLVLAGDIASGSTNTMDVIKYFRDQGFPQIVYVPGNHEYYGTGFDEFNAKMENKCMEFENVHFLNCNTIEIQDVVFIGASLWTNFRNDWFAEKQASRFIADFKYIKGFTTAHAAQLYQEHSNFIMREVADNQHKRCVVVSHFLPTDTCIADKYRDPRLSDLNPYFANDLEQQISTFNNVTWLFGHTHDVVNKVCGNTRLIANPHGYFNSGEGQYFDPFKTIEV